MDNFTQSVKGTSEVYSRVFQKSREIIECSRDFILPDFYADIRRIISYTGNISPESCFVENSKVTISGALTTQVLFLDDDNKLRAVTFTQDYSSSIPVSDPGTYGDISLFCCPILENVSVKTVNPRKVSVRGRIDANMKLWKNMSVSPEISDISGNNNSSYEIKTEKISYMKPFSIWERDLEVSDDIFIDGEAEEIIYCDARSEVLETVSENNSITVKGNIDVDVIYSPTDKRDPIQVRRRIPFARTLESEFSALDSIVCCACSYIRSADCSLSSVNAGENNKIEVDVGYTLVLNGAEVVSCEYVSDMYLPAFAVKNEKKKISFSSEPLKTVKMIRVESCTESMLPEGSEIIISSVNPTVDSISGESSARSAFGNSYINVTYKDRDGLFGSQSFSGDFEIELSELDDFDEYIFLVRVSSVNARLEENRLCVGYDLEITVLSWKSEMSDVIRSSQVTANEEREIRKPFTVYYPSKNETLWDIGKKYNVPLSSLASSNPEYNSEKSASVLLIPRCKAGKKA